MGTASMGVKRRSGAGFRLSYQARSAGSTKAL